MTTDQEGNAEATVAAEEDVTAESFGLEGARKTLGDLVIRAGYGNERIVITRKGKPTAALVGIRDLERLRSLDAA